jgi:hypothetical protein
MDPIANTCVMKKEMGSEAQSKNLCPGNKIGYEELLGGIMNILFLSLIHSICQYLRKISI